MITDSGSISSSRYRRDEPIGSGAYGTVYKAVDLLTQQYVALKKIKIESEEEGIPSTAVREMCILRHLSHDNIVQLKDVIMDELQVILVFELEDTDLKKYMDRTTELLPLELVQSYSAQIICGLKYLHSMGVMHRDLKPQNILLSKEGVLKLADFGLSRAFTAYVRPLTAEHVITIWYRAPEVLLGATCYNASVDMWSAACVIAEMSSKKALFGGTGEFDQLIKIFMSLGTPQVEAWPDIVNLPYWRNTFPDFFPYKWSHILPNLDEDGRDLISKILVFDPNGRLSARDALNHPFVRQYVVRTPMGQSPREDRFSSPTNFECSSSPRSSSGFGIGKNIVTPAEFRKGSAPQVLVLSSSSSSSSSSSHGVALQSSTSNFALTANRSIKRSNSMPNPSASNANDVNSNNLLSNSTASIINKPPAVSGMLPSVLSQLVQTSTELPHDSHHASSNNAVSHAGAKVSISTNKSFSTLPKYSVGQSSAANKWIGHGCNSGYNNNKENTAIPPKVDSKVGRRPPDILESLDNSMTSIDESFEIDTSKNTSIQYGDSDLTDNSDSNHSSHILPSNPQRATEEDSINANISAAITNINRKQQELKGGDKKAGRTRKNLQIVSGGGKDAISSILAYRLPVASPETISSGQTSSASSILSSDSSNTSIKSSISSDDVSNGDGKSNGELKNKGSNLGPDQSKRKLEDTLVDNPLQKKHASDANSGTHTNSGVSSDCTNANKVYSESKFMKDAKLMAQLTEGVGRLTRRQLSVAGMK